MSSIIESATVAVHNGKLIATLKGHEEVVDENHARSSAASTATNDWDKSKPGLRKLMTETIDAFALVNTTVHTVNLLGTQNRFIEVASTNRRKEIPGTMASQVDALQAGLGTELVTEDVELTIKGELAMWVLKNLKDAGQEGNPSLVVKRKTILVPKFEEVRRNVKKNLNNGSTVHLAEICDVLATVGIQAAAVEAKTFKDK